jgi:hypothetical protein
LKARRLPITRIARKPEREFKPGADLIRAMRV